MTTSVILSIDVGSSSIRCTPYKYLNDADGTGAGATRSATSPSSPSNKNKHKFLASRCNDIDKSTIIAIDQCASVCNISCVEADTGYILLQRKCSTANTSRTILQDINGCIDETIASLRVHQHETFQIIAVGITTFVMNLIGIDNNGENVSLGKEYTCSYACNLQSVQHQCHQLKEHLGGEKEKELYQKTGAPIHPAYAIGQLRHIYQKLKDNDTLEIKGWTTIASMCIAQWSGTDVLSLPISYSEASWTGMLDFHSGTFDAEYMDLLPISCRDALPIVSDKVVEGLSHVYRQRWPEMSEGCTFMLGCGDGACANIGSKCTDVDRIAVTIGTSAAARIVLPLKIVQFTNPIEEENGSCNEECEDVAKRRKTIHHSFQVPHGLFCYRIDCDLVLLGGALTDGGSVIAWLRGLLNLKSEEEYMQCQEKADRMYLQCLTEIKSNSKPLTMIPFLSGERSTGYRGGAFGCITGLTRCTTSADLVKESLESVVLRINAILELILGGSKELVDRDGRTPIIIASGNALENNRLWRKMLADCSKMDVILDYETHEGTSRGAALMVAKELTKNRYLQQEPLSIIHTSKPSERSQFYWSRKVHEQDEVIRNLEALWTG